MATQDDIVLPAYTFRRRQAADVPEDIDEMEHFNDPNWDAKSMRSFDSSTDFELDDKKDAAKSFGGDDKSMDYTARGSEYDTESHIGTTTQAESSAALHEEYNEFVLPRTCYRYSLTTVTFSSESPYPEVRAAVSNIDDPNMPVNTFRMWVIGLFYTILVSGLNQFFSMRCESFPRSSDDLCADSSHQTPPSSSPASWHS